MNLEPTLTKENFWNEMMEKYPKATKAFCEWIDEYKKAVEWDELFANIGRLNEDVPGGFRKKVKFHDIPYAMQYGIWMEFCRQTSHQYFEQGEHPSATIDLAEDVKSVLSEIDELIGEGD
jgi:hypothetical protein